MLDTDRLDLVLVEGFKNEAIPKIELHRPSLGRPLLFPRDPNIIAIASDSEDLAQAPLHIPRLSLDRAEEIADFVLGTIGRKSCVETGLADKGRMW